MYVLMFVHISDRLYVITADHVTSKQWDPSKKVT